MCLKLIELLPNCEADIVPLAQHFAFEENPAEFIDRVEKHFRDGGFQPTAPTSAARPPAAQCHDEYVTSETNDRPLLRLASSKP